MPHRPVPIKKFKKFLRSLGLKKMRTKGDHEIWDDPVKPLARPIVIVSGEPEVPALHIKSNLNTLGIDEGDFWQSI